MGGCLTQFPEIRRVELCWIPVTQYTACKEINEPSRSIKGGKYD